MSFNELTSDDSEIIPLAGFISSNRANVTGNESEQNIRPNLDIDSDISYLVGSVNNKAQHSPAKRSQTRSTNRIRSSLTEMKYRNISSHSESDDGQAKKSRVVKDVLNSPKSNKSLSKKERTTKRLSLQKRQVCVESASSDSDNSEYLNDIKMIARVKKSPQKKSRTDRRKSLPALPVRDSSVSNTEIEQDEQSRKSEKRSRLSLEGRSGTEPVRPHLHSMRFECPDDYHRLPPVSDDGTAFIEDLEDEDVELWLCKVPIDIDVDTLNGKSINQNGSTTISTKNAKKKQNVKKTELYFEKINNCQENGVLTVLAPSRKDGHLHPVCKELTGLITVRDRFTPEPYVVPPPRPKVKREIPQGLKQRYIPFGSDSPQQISLRHIHKKRKKDKRKSELPD